MGFFRFFEDMVVIGGVLLLVYLGLFLALQLRRFLKRLGLLLDESRRG